jgi:hypothetical protein
MTVAKGSHLMKSFLAVAILLVMVLGAASCPADSGADAAPRVSVMIERSDVVVVVDNPGNSDIDIAYPLPLISGREFGGIHLEFRRIDDSSEKLFRMCSSYDEREIPTRRRLAPGERVEERFDLGVLKTFYCLDSGEHEVIATFVNRVDADVLATPAKATTRVHID